MLHVLPQLRPQQKPPPQQKLPQLELKPLLWQLPQKP
jgi:hypothetical protein